MPHGGTGIEFETVDFGFDSAVRVEIGKDTLLGVAYGVVEFVYQQCYVTQSCTAVFASVGNENNLSDTRYLVVE